jgi:hypothetical protein
VSGRGDRPRAALLSRARQAAFGGYVPRMRPTLTILTTLAALAALASLSRPAAAETIVKERFGCHTQEVTDRLFKLVMAGDEEGFGQLLRVSLASGECRSWKLGEEVRLESRTMTYGCLALTDGQDRCYWTPLSAIEKAG